MNEYIHPRDILVPLDRQRRELGDVTELQASIAQVGLINPIIVRQDGDTWTLVAGGRRRQACENLDRVLEIGRDVQLWSDLDPLTARVIELEENVKREDLDWRDQARANAALHHAYVHRADETDEAWSTTLTAAALSITDRAVRRYLSVERGLRAGRLDTATGMEHALLILARQSDRMSEQIVDEIIAGGVQAFDLGASSEPQSILRGDNGSDTGNITSYTPPQRQGGLDIASSVVTGVSGDNDRLNGDAPIICADFTTWAPAYSGPKFNLIHVDFPYGVAMHNEIGQQFTADAIPEGDEPPAEPLYANTPDLYFGLLDAFCANLDRFASYQSHVVFWFSMTWYGETKSRLEKAGLRVFPHPLIWMKHAGAAPGQFEHPRQIYDTALLCSLGGRKLVKTGGNAYVAPIPSNRIHPSEKSASMLRYFLEMLVDETTTVFDPTAGSGIALRVADELGARRVLGLELSPEYAESAQRAFGRARMMREASR